MPHYLQFIYGIYVTLYLSCFTQFRMHSWPFFFFTALKRHTRVVETSGVDARDQRRKRAPFAKGLERKRAPFRLLIHPKSPATQATHNYTRCLYMKFICAISRGCFRF